MIKVRGPKRSMLGSDFVYFEWMWEEREARGEVKIAEHQQANMGAVMHAVMADLGSKVAILGGRERVVVVFVVDVNFGARSIKPAGDSDAA